MLAKSGLARSMLSAVLETLKRSLMISVAGKSVFRDHHRYSAGDLRRLESAAQKAGAAAFVTTEKDAQNFEHGNNTALPIFVSVIDFVLTSESEFLAAIERKIHSLRGAAA